MMLAVYNLFLPDTTGSLGQIYQIFVGADKVNWLHLGVWSFVLSVAITMMFVLLCLGAELSQITMSAVWLRAAEPYLTP